MGPFGVVVDEPGVEIATHNPPHDDGKPHQKKAVKCDMCKDIRGGPACVRSCPTGAAIRISPEELIRYAQSRS